jgi:hypothetical protein
MNEMRPFKYAVAGLLVYCLALTLLIMRLMI